MNCLSLSLDTPATFAYHGTFPPSKFRNNKSPQANRNGYIHPASHFRAREGRCRHIPTRSPLSLRSPTRAREVAKLCVCVCVTMGNNSRWQVEQSTTWAIHLHRYLVWSDNNSSQLLTRVYPHTGKLSPSWRRIIRRKSCSASWRSRITNVSRQLTSLYIDPSLILDLRTIHLPLPTTTNQSRTPLSPTFSACVDCGTPSPQWASVSYGTYVCLECSGAHRGLGVHLSFIRSLTMDKWSDDQMNKMRFGGNRAFKEFMEGYVKEEGGWRKGMGIQEKYKTWAAAQYREKVSTSRLRLRVVFRGLNSRRPLSPVVS